MTSTIKIEDDLRSTFEAFAIELCAAAAKESLSYFRQNPAIENKAKEQGLLDPVTIADQQTEAVIIEKIRKTFPEHTIIGEETGTQENTSEYTWVIDPIDGTGSFICGIPLWGTLIGLLKNGAPVLGVMDQPFLREQYIGTADRACRISAGTQTDITVSPCASLKDARLATTSPDLFNEAESATFEKIKKNSKLTRYGTDCTAYALLASGQIDLVIEAGLNAYDICALIPIIEGAGGVITTWQGDAATQGGQIIAAATAELHAEALALLG